MADERTPLIQVVNVAPHRDRYTHHRLRRFCTIVLAIVPIFIGTIFVLCLFLPDSFWDKTPFRQSYHSLSRSKGSHVSYGELQKILLTTPHEIKAREWSEYYTAGPHLAGKNLSQAIWTKDLWQKFGVSNTEIVSYDVYVNYPAGHRLALLQRNRNDSGDERQNRKGGWSVDFEASLEEDVLEEDSTSGLKDRIPTFHGYSASGNVTAPYVFVNYGTYYDFEDLIKANVSLEGKIALAKYGHVFRGLKVKRAQELGMIGAIIYTDPGDDGKVTEINGYLPYPEGPARQPSSVQRGSTQFLSIAPGDPTTPGYPSKPGAPRQPVDQAIPSIPSIPISYLDALPLLRALNGHGPKASSLNKYWEGGGLGYKGVEYHIGPSPDHLAVNLMNKQDYVTTPMWNVIGIINGTIPDEVVILGNHRDAWIAGGAGDPNSGSAALNEIVRSLGLALSMGWKPLRTIVLASWDGEEYGLIGSTEWVEEYIPWLSNSAVAYLNVDVGARGPDFIASASPLLNQALISTANLVISPNQTNTGQTVGDIWDKHIRPMGSGSDFTAFQDFAGIPCVDMGFTQSKDSAVYHYHSNYDSFDWMDRYGDRDWHYHVTIARLWGLLAAKLVETPIIPLNMTDYGIALGRYLDAVRRKAKESNFDISQLSCSSFEDGDGGSRTHETTDPLTPLAKAIDRFQIAAIAFDDCAATLLDTIQQHYPWWQWWKLVKLWYAARRINTRIKILERQFLYAPGLDGRNWFKHTVFAPGLWTGYSGATFPGLVEGVEAQDQEKVWRWAGILTGLVNKATAVLAEDDGK